MMLLKIFLFIIFPIYCITMINDPDIKCLSVILFLGFLFLAQEIRNIGDKLQQKR